MILSMIQEPEPDWDDLSNAAGYPVELKFNLDDHLVQEIKSAYQEVEKTVSFVLKFVILLETYSFQFI